jgi:3-oxoacyl-[acyl-carrier protein] reductase
MAGRGWVLITGGSRGIGAATALALAGRGFDLILWARTAGPLAETAEQARRLGARVRHAAVDVGDPAQVERAATGGHDSDVPAPGRQNPGGLPELAGLVLGAGGGQWSDLADLEPAAWRDTLETNLTGAYNVLRAGLPRLDPAGRRLVVGVLSDSALHPFAGRAAYSAAKAGMAALLEVTRREVRADGIRVSSVFPSRVDTHFRGGHADAAPGSRPGALTAENCAEVVAGLFDLPPNVEIRQIQLSAMTSTFGLLPERVLP